MRKIASRQKEQHEQCIGESGGEKGERENDRMIRVTKKVKEYNE